NERARELLALPAGHDGAGRPLVAVARQPQVSETLRALAAGSAVISRDLTLDGAERTTLQVNGARLCGPDGQPFGYVLVLHDVSELRRLEVIRRDFVANVSHELRTPLTAMKGYAETLLGPAGDDRETRRRFLSVIDRHSERLGRLIDDLLTLSDLELGRSPLRLGMVAVAPAVEDVLQILSDPAARGGVDLGARIDPATPALEADADRFRQVLINLVDNAIKYTSGGGRVFVRATAARGAEHEGMVEIAVEDTGVGIPGHDRARLAAAHGDEHVGARDQVAGQATRPGRSELDAQLPHDLLDRRVHPLRGLAPGRERARGRRLGERVEERRRHLRAAGVLD